VLAKYTPRARFRAMMAWRFVYALRGILFYGLMSALAPSKRYTTKYWRYRTTAAWIAARTRLLRRLVRPDSAILAAAGTPPRPHNKPGGDRKPRQA